MKTLLYVVCLFNADTCRFCAGGSPRVTDIYARMYVSVIRQLMLIQARLSTLALFNEMTLKCPAESILFYQDFYCMVGVITWLS